MAEPLKTDVRRAEGLAYLAAAFALLLLGLGAVLLGGAQAYSLQPPVIASGVTLALALAGAFRLRLLRRQQEEERAVAAFRASHAAGGELFAEADEAVKLAARANRTYVTWILPALTALAGAALAGAAWWLWRAWSGVAAPVPPLKPLLYAGFLFPLFVGAMLAGSFFSGVSREPGCRWLRPAGSWFLFSGALYGLAVLALLLQHLELPLPRVDMRAGRLGLALLMAFGVELLLNMIVELYRPRTPGEAERPLPESRLLTLVTEPGGLARNVAAALDYQFGFKVTDVWFYRFLERTVIPFSALALFLMWLMTGLIVVRPEQNGVLQRFGRVANPGAPLRPGLHLKWPWPIDTVYLFPVARVQEIPIGYVPGDAAASAEPGGDLSGRVMVWSKAHNKEESKFAVASRQAADRPPLGEELRVLPVDVSFLAASIPLYFRVTDLYANQFRHRDGGATLRALAHREVTLYLANVDFNAILSTGRGQGGEELRRRIQAAADHVGLGIEIVAVGLQGLHPPVEVGKEFDAVVAAMEEMHETVLKAGTGASRAILEREGADAAVLATAHSYRQRRVEVAHAEADRFAMQLKAYSASPEMFSLNAYLEIFQNEGRNVRKYILGGETGRKVYILNLEKKLRPDLLDLDFSQPE